MGRGVPGSHRRSQVSVSRLDVLVQHWVLTQPWSVHRCLGGLCCGDLASEGTPQIRGTLTQIFGTLFILSPLSLFYSFFFRPGDDTRLGDLGDDGTAATARFLLGAFEHRISKTCRAAIATDAVQIATWPFITRKMRHGINRSKQFPPFSVPGPAAMQQWPSIQRSSETLSAAPFAAASPTHSRRASYPSRRTC